MLALLSVMLFGLFGLTIGEPLTDGPIKQAILDWCVGGNTRTAIEKKYGLIADWDTSQVTNMAQLFLWSQAGCNPAIGKWNTGKVTTMERMFDRAFAFNQDINGWNTSAVTNMRQMFIFAKTFDRDIGAWDTSKVTTLNGMFWGAEVFNQNIGKWNTAAVTDTKQMFVGAIKFDQNISPWDTSKMKDMSSMLHEAKRFNQKLCWNVRPGTDTKGIFTRTACPNGNCWATLTNDGCTPPFNNAELTQAVLQWCAGGENRTAVESVYGDIAKWDTSKVTKMWELFEGQSTCNPDIGNWNTGKVTTMHRMFTQAYAFNQPLGKWDMASVTHMSWMFAHARSFNQDIGFWNTTKVIDMTYTFYGANAFNQKLCWTKDAARTSGIFEFTSCPGKNCWGTVTSPGTCS